MFTGIIQDLGKIDNLVRSSTDVTITIAPNQLELSNVTLGDSIAINGVCLTVTQKNEKQFSADISNETLQKTTLKNLTIGQFVNLEKALTLASHLGGHLVSGHVDGVGKLINKKPDGKSTRYYFSVPENLLKYIAVKGSITIQGISLTVNNVTENGFDVSIIPHTEMMTNLGKTQINEEVNLEIDLIARYVERLLFFENKTDTNNVNVELLQRTGFL